MKPDELKKQKHAVGNNSGKENQKEIFSYSIYNKENFKIFTQLKENKQAKIIKQNDLPKEFNEDLCNFINLFRRKTFNEKTEWEFYIDYENNEIIHCLHGGPTNVKDWFHSGLMKNKKIVTIHNHIKGTYSAPSWKNFEILDHEFEDYEIICAEKEFWILEAKGTNDKNYTLKFKTKIENIFQETISKSIVKDIDFEKYNPNDDYSIRVQEYISNQKNNIKLSKKEYQQHDKISKDWKISDRDNEMHRLDWGKNNPQLIIEERKKLKEKIIKLNKEMGNTIDLEKEYPNLFNKQRLHKIR